MGNTHMDSRFAMFTDTFYRPSDVRVFLLASSETCKGWLDHKEDEHALELPLACYTLTVNEIDWGFWIHGWYAR